ncbi:putative pentatricopeptide repeat-containing protein At3g13770, mitochondrial [Cryptomeria japonica]|uniref:putative pentatricopeptide repeat-containing protein At3g13770, mitochondrial n=1 Tax=Cryptomeria japonica TaxID=3369 RepID=UPI0025AD2D17|nr:putative pentatricopeptide repeat-containing protein At3g13770, mitochondrial [Cryptomeria japonica]
MLQAYFSPNQARKNLYVNFHLNAHTIGNTQIQAKIMQAKHARISSHDIEAQMNKLCLYGRLKEALDLFGVINSMGVLVESNIYAHLLHACADMRALAEGRQIHAQMVVSGIKVNAFLGTKLLNMYAQCRRLVEAKLYFDIMPRRNVYSWNTIIGVYARDGFYEKAIELYNQMQVSGVQPDVFIFPSVLKACAGLGDLEQGRKIHSYIDGSRFKSDVFVGNALNASETFSVMECHDCGYAQSGNHGDKALNLLREIVLAGVELGSITILSALRACSELSTIQQGKEIHCYVMRMGLEFDSARNAAASTTMISGYIEDGQNGIALKLFRHMQVMGVDADSVTISSILPACAHSEALKHCVNTKKWSMPVFLRYIVFLRFN